MRDERTGVGSSRYGLEYGGLHLHVAEGVEILSHGLHDAGPLDEHILDLGIDHKVHVSHTVTLLRIRECVIDLTLLLLHYRQHPERLGEHRKALGVNGELTGLGDEGIALYADEVTYIQQLLEDGIVHRLVLARTDLVALDIDLNPALGVLQLDKRGGSHDTAAHHPAGY